MSDQYVKLEEERRQKERAEKKKKEKKKRKEKRSRGKKHDSGPESEEDITPAHMVDIVTEEMPEVRLSHINVLWQGRRGDGDTAKYISLNVLLMHIQTMERITFELFSSCCCQSIYSPHNLINFRTLYPVMMMTETLTILIKPSTLTWTSESFPYKSRSFSRFLRRPTSYSKCI